jgi:hypothetical protein
MAKTPRDTQEMFRMIGEIHQSTETLTKNQDEMFKRLRDDEEKIALQKQRCDSVQTDKFKKEELDGKVKEKKHTFLLTILAALIITSIVNFTAACYKVWSHIDDQIKAEGIERKAP